MAISRMQEPRQLYGLGSLVRKITRPIKKAVKGVTKIAKSPLGKAALLAAAGTYGLGALGSGSFNPLTSGFFSRANLAKGLGTFFSTGNPLLFKGGKFNLGRAGITASVLGAALPFLAPGLLAPKEEEVEEVDITQTPASIAALNQRARDFYNYGDQDLLFMPQQQYVMRNFYAADGGIADARPGYRVGGASGREYGQTYDPDATATDTPMATSDDNDSPVTDVIPPPPKDDTPTLIAGGDALTLPTLGSGPFNLMQLKRIRDFGYNVPDVEKLDEFQREELFKALERDPFTAAEGGSVPESKVKGFDTPAGFNKFDYPTGGVPVRTPKKQGGLMDLGGLEMDFRAEGGFVPIGAKEKADDVPARLSKNEFVMTADAVRGAGKGNIKAGAQKMYNTMKELERRVV